MNPKQRRVLPAVNTGQSKSGQNNVTRLIPLTFKRAANPANESSESLNGKRQKLCPTFADLPFEVVEAILENVPSLDLVKCRQVNRRWNRISSNIMRQRSDIELQFEFENDEFMHRIQFRRCAPLLVDGCTTLTRIGSKSLTDLVECLAQATNFPFTNFRFDWLSNWNNDIRSFLAVWGANIVTLHLTFVGDIPIQYIEFHLPKLAVLGVKGIDATNRDGFIDKILRAATNLKVFVAGDSTKENDFCDGLQLLDASILKMLQSTQKLHCLKSAKIHVSQSLIGYWQRNPTTMGLKLESLALSFKGTVLYNQQMKSTVTAIVNQLFRSSENDLQSLSISNVGCLTGLAIPKLKNLESLRLQNMDEDGEVAMFPPLFNLAGTFPKVKELVFATSQNVIPAISDQPLNRSSNTLRSVEKLRLSFTDDEADVELHEDYMKITPNLKTLLIDGDRRFYSSGHVDFKKMSENWPKLENFGWQVYVESHDRLRPEMDAFLTGLPKTLCKELAEKFCNKNRLSADEVAAYHLNRAKPSILDLKQLKRFDIGLSLSEDVLELEGYGIHDYCGDAYQHFDEAGFDRNSIYFKTGMTKVTKFLAFDQMPKLNVRTHRNMIW